MTKVALYFGSFNPIHNAHIALSEYILQHTEVEELWFVVTPQNPLKEAHTLLADKHRVKMVEIAIGGNKRFRVCDVELSLPKPNYTVNTLSHLSQTYADCQFSLIIGADNMLIFDRWRDYDKILKHHNVYVYPREGCDVNVLSPFYNQMTYLHYAPLINISSTAIREKIMRHEDTKQLINQDIYKYIMLNNLYADC